MAGPPPHHHHHHHHHLLHHHHHPHNLIDHPFSPRPPHHHHLHLHPHLHLLFLLCPCRRHHHLSNPNPNSILPPHFTLPSFSSSTNPSAPSPAQQLLIPISAEGPHNTDSLQQQDWKEEVELDDEDGEDIFVLTDEWMDFFAKSEAKRCLDKQKKHKKGRK